MKKTIMLLLVLTTLTMFSVPAFAYRSGQSPKDGGYTQDAYGGWTRNDNLYKDSDGDGVNNYNDRNDRNSNIF